MALTLSCRDVDAFTALQLALVSPVEAASVDDWCRNVLRRAEALFCADRSLILVPAGGQPQYISDSIDLEALSAAERTVAQLKPVALQVSDPAEDRAWNARRVCPVEVWNVESAARLMGIASEHLPACQEAMQAAGIACGVAASINVGQGHAVLAVCWSERARAPFDEEAALELMRMVLPAFKTAVCALPAATDPLRGVTGMLDALGESLLVFDRRGRELHRSRKLREALAEDPEREFLLRELRALGESLIPPIADQAEGPPCPVGTLKLATATARYRARGAYAEGGLLGQDPVVLVALERVSRELPTAQQLAVRHGLTPREAEVALLLARGLSNREIGARLALSRSTVRHHAEWVFSKLGVHSRKALGLTLIGRAEEQAG